MRQPDLRAYAEFGMRAFVDIPSSTVPADGPLPPLLLGFLGAEVAEDPPVGEAEGVGHGVADVGLWEE